MTKKKTPKKIKVTLEDVLNVTQKGFERVDKRFDEMEERMDKRFIDLEDSLTEKIEKVDAKVTGLSGRVEVIEDTVRVIKTKIGI